MLEKATTLAATALISNLKDAETPGTETEVREVMRAALLTGN